MTRPWINLGIDRLEKMYLQSQSEPQVLQDLENELQHRKTSRSIALLSKVQSALCECSHSSSQSLKVSLQKAVENSDSQLTRRDRTALFAKSPDEAADRLETQLPSPSNMLQNQQQELDGLELELLYMVPPTGSIGNTRLRSLLAERGWNEEQYWTIRDRLIERGILEAGRGKGGSVRRTSAAVATIPSSASDQATQPVTVEQVSSAASSPLLPKQAVMQLGDACRVLCVKSSSSWEEIELARRKMVQQASPLRTAEMDEAKRTMLQEQARRANQAYLSIWRIQIGDV